MNTRVLLLFATVGLSLSTFAQSTAFTYQGRLNQSGSPATGLYEISFALYDSATNGNLISTPVTVAPVPVTNGLFTASLDFGPNAFTGAPRWLEVSVTAFGSDQPVVTLSPRQPINPTPYSIHAANATTLSSPLEGPLDLTIGGESVLHLERNQRDIVNLVGGSPLNVLASGSYGSVIVGGGGTLDCRTDYVPENDTWDCEELGPFFPAPNKIDGRFSVINGGAANYTQGDLNLISGGSFNYIGSSGWSAILGGAENSISNARSSTIAGGFKNQISEYTALVSIGGGEWNRIAGGSLSSIGGGYGNYLIAYSSTISGGHDNTIEDYVFASTIPGGFGNSVRADRSFAAGSRADANHPGCFVWADSSSTPDPDFDLRFSSKTNNEFAVRATGGVRFVTAIDTNGTPTAVASLAPGSGTWSSLSDRNAKENFTPADPRATLDKVAALPIATWNYKSQDKSIRHIGPMAQDFHAAFNVGENDRTITTVDADGVAFAAIQGLNEKLEHELKAKDAQIRQLQADLAEVKQLLQNLTTK